MIIIKDQRAIEAMRIAGRLTGQVLTAVTDIIRPGISTADID
ncbi:MAG: methionine aminopeptidase, partial [Oceanicoccus sp.]